LATQLEPSRLALAATLQADEDTRSSSFEAAKKLQGAVKRATQGVQDGQLDVMRQALAEARTLIAGLGIVPPQPARNGALANLFEEVVAVEGYVHFFATGRLVRKANLPPCIDDEVCGAVPSSSLQLRCRARCHPPPNAHGTYVCVARLCAVRLCARSLERVWRALGRSTWAGALGFRKAWASTRCSGAWRAT
jgi:hypothetical protein